MNKDNLENQVADINKEWEGKVALVADRYLVRFCGDDGKLVNHEVDNSVSVVGFVVDTKNIESNKVRTELVCVATEGGLPNLVLAEEELLDFWKHHILFTLEEVKKATTAMFSMLCAEGDKEREAVKEEYVATQVAELSELIRVYEEEQEDGEKE